jgi:hypothetical protein
LLLTFFFTLIICEYPDPLKNVITIKVNYCFFHLNDPEFYIFFFRRFRIDQSFWIQIGQCKTFFSNLTCEFIYHENKRTICTTGWNSRIIIMIDIKGESLSDNFPKADFPNGRFPKILVSIMIIPPKISGKLPSGKSVTERISLFLVIVG